MITNFFNNRIIVATTAALMLHAMAFGILFDTTASSPIAPNLFSNNISINLSKVFNKTFEKKKAEKKTIIAKKSFTESPIQTTSVQNQQTPINEIPLTSNFKLNGERIAPTYPKRALRLKQEGVVYLKILVSETGITQKIIFAQKSNYTLLNKAALEAVKQWKFQPSIINGVVSASWIEVPIEFKIV